MLADIQIPRAVKATDVWDIGSIPAGVKLSWYFYTCMGHRNRFQGMNSASLCSLAGRYDNPLPLRFLAPMASLKIPTLVNSSTDFDLSQDNLYMHLNWHAASRQLLDLITPSKKFITSTFVCLYCTVQCF